MYPARLVGRVEINGDTTLVTDAVAQTIRQSRELGHVDGVHAVLVDSTRPGNTDRYTQITAVQTDAKNMKRIAHVGYFETECDNGGSVSFKVVDLTSNNLIASSRLRARDRETARSV